MCRPSEEPANAMGAFPLPSNAASLWHGLKEPDEEVVSTRLSTIAISVCRCKTSLASMFAFSH